MSHVYVGRKKDDLVIEFSRTKGVQTRVFSPITSTIEATLDSFAQRVFQRKIEDPVFLGLSEESKGIVPLESPEMDYIKDSYRRVSQN